MYIGKIKIEPPVALAPMAGVTDMPFRILCKQQGSGLLVSEMVSSKGLLYNNKKTIDMLRFEEFERPFAVQLFGNEPKEMAQAARQIAQFKPDVIDVNMGCPVPKVVNNGEGSALMKNPDLVYEIVARMVDSVDIPVTVKIRAGWDENSINAVKVAQKIEAAGAAVVAVHARTRSQFYMGNADWQIIKNVKAALKIPVFGNGDIKSAEDADKMMKETGCDAVMVGRAAEGNPWLFAEIKAYLMGDVAPAKVSVQQRFALMLKHLEMLVRHKGEDIAIKEMRRHAASYSKGLPYAAEFRALFNAATGEKDFLHIVQNYLVRLS